MTLNYPERYSSLTLDDINYLNTLISVTARTCKDPGIPVIKRSDLSKFIQTKWELPNPISVYTFNQMALYCHRALEDCPLRLKTSPSATKYILADSAKRVVDCLLTQQTHRKEAFLRECEENYLKTATVRKRGKLQVPSSPDIELLADWDKRFELATSKPKEAQ